jgi:hypothetical protein
MTAGAAVRPVRDAATADCVSVDLRRVSPPDDIPPNLAVHPTRRSHWRVDR